MVRVGKERTLDGQLTADDRQLLGARTTVKVSDEPADAIGNYAKAEAVDLIVIGTHGRTGLERVLLGSVAERVIRIAPCPVLTVRHPEHEFVVPDAPESGAA
jgi:nucleotide-binding universal stress UspA family protein